MGRPISAVTTNGQPDNGPPRASAPTDAPRRGRDKAMAWIELHQTLPSHRKTLRLKALLGLKTGQAVGHLCLLWLWALDNVKDGDLSGVTPQELAQVADFPTRRAAAFVDALVDAGFLDRQGERLCIHGWEDYTDKLMELRRRNRLRQRKCREKKSDMSCDCDVTNVTVTGLPNQTEPDPTKPDQTEPNLNCTL